MNRLLERLLNLVPALKDEVVRASDGCLSGVDIDESTNRGGELLIVWPAKWVCVGRRDFAGEAGPAAVEGCAIAAKREAGQGLRSNVASCPTFRDVVEREDGIADGALGGFAIGVVGGGATTARGDCADKAGKHAEGRKTHRFRITDGSSTKAEQSTDCGNGRSDHMAIVRE